MLLYYIALYKSLGKDISCKTAVCYPVCFFGIDQENKILDGNKGQENHVTQELPGMVQCNKCGMPLCSRCCMKLEAISIENTSQYSEDDESSTPHYHLDECRIFQNAGFENLPLKNLKSIQQIYSILSPLRLLIKARKNPALLDLEVNQNVSEC